MPKATNLENLADANLAAVARLHHPWQEGAALLDSDGLLCHRGSLPIPAPFQNWALRTSNALSAAEALARTERFFGGSTNPYAVQTNSRIDADLNELLAQRGYHCQSDVPAMLADAPMAVPALGSQWTLGLAETDADVSGFVDVCAQSYASLGLPSFLTPAYFAQRSAVLSPVVSIVLARDAAGQAVSAAMALHTGEMAGLYWVCTRPEARGAGLGAACTAMATQVAFERGARGITLQASHMGEQIYRRMGFREYARSQRWSR
jgi:GNAT superfamily N-acetyltransferase